MKTLSSILILICAGFIVGWPVVFFPPIQAAGILALWLLFLYFTAFALFCLASGDPQ